MVDTQQVEHGGVEVVDVDLVLYGEEAIVVGGAVLDPGFHAAAGEDGGESVGVMVAAVGALGNRGSTEFAADDDEGVLEQSARLEVFDEGSNRLVHLFRIALVIAAEGVVLVPLVGVRDLDESHAFFAEAAGEEALVAKVAGFGVVDAVQLLGFLRFSGDLLELGGGELHAEGEFVGVDAALKGGIGANLMELI